MRFCRMLTNTIIAHIKCKSNGRCGRGGAAGRCLDKVAGNGAMRLGRLRGNVRFLAQGGDSGGAGRRGMW